MSYEQTKDESQGHLDEKPLYRLFPLDAFTEADIPAGVFELPGAAEVLVEQVVICLKEVRAASQE